MLTTKTSKTANQTQKVLLISCLKGLQKPFKTFFCNFYHYVTRSFVYFN